LNLIDVVERVNGRPNFCLGPSTGDDEQIAVPVSRLAVTLGPSVGDDSGAPMSVLGPSVGDDANPGHPSALGPCVGDDLQELSDRR
jgi:hypothetical protein